MEEDVGAFDQAGERVEVAGLFEIEDDAALAAVEPGEVGGEAAQRAIVAAGEIAAIGPLDFDDIGAYIGELARAKGRGDGLLERHDANAAQW